MTQRLETKKPDHNNEAEGSADHADQEEDKGWKKENSKYREALASNDRQRWSLISRKEEISRDQDAIVEFRLSIFSKRTEFKNGQALVDCSTQLLDLNQKMREACDQRLDQLVSAFEQIAMSDMDGEEPAPQALQDSLATTNNVPMNLLQERGMVLARMNDLLIDAELSAPSNSPEVTAFYQAAHDAYRQMLALPEVKMLTLPPDKPRQDLPDREYNVRATRYYELVMHRVEQELISDEEFAVLYQKLGTNVPDEIPNKKALIELGRKASEFKLQSVALRREMILELKANVQLLKTADQRDRLRDLVAQGDRDIAGLQEQLFAVEDEFQQHSLAISRELKNAQDYGALQRSLGPN